MKGRFYPKCSSKPHNYGWWPEDIAKNLVCRYHSQGGTEYSQISNSCMQEDLDFLLQEIGEQIYLIHNKAFKLLSQKRVKNVEK